MAQGGAFLSSGGSAGLSPQHAALQRGGFHSGGSSASEEELHAAVSSPSNFARTSRTYVHAGAHILTLKTVGAW